MAMERGQHVAQDLNLIFGLVLEEFPGFEDLSCPTRVLAYLTFFTMFFDRLLHYIEYLQIN